MSLCVLNEPAPDMTLTDLETGEQKQLLELVESSKKYTILTFYATWSKASEREVETMEIFSKDRHNKLLNFVLGPRVCRYFGNGNEPTVVHYGAAEVPEPYGLQSVPHTVVIDPQGTVLRNGDNFHWDDIAALLRHRQEVTDPSYLKKIMSWALPPITA
ncbi:uncharacterized protein PITG_08884 [Phytophthora infestans T30-4]|uniref:Thioredoxin domain-containing protein n=1 Tax=Phytophthora infestans (strain T30-4) TaxID=403677 RepID=D0NDF0_PHYIT|nr:uncharacterized protein PITG_08884 [Phytophthora infestans T30-4]EEY56107.1 conserved hypothetical protein [Phytophthora infestans T30-4]|eukprot:XP_002902937.1 conserved hypothetical protein [Phytophthora infestans T30-4]